MVLHSLSLLNEFKKLRVKPSLGGHEIFLRYMLMRGLLVAHRINEGRVRPHDELGDLEHVGWHGRGE